MQSKDGQMGKNFYFGKDADIVAGSANFAALITASPTTYGLTAGQATAFGTLNTALQSAWTASVNPSTRTPVSIDAKTLAIENMRGNAKLLAKIVYATLTVNDSQLTALGLLPRPTYSPVPAPAEAPEIDIVSVSGNTVRIRLHRESGPKRGKLPGTKGAQVYSFVGTTPPTVETDWKFEGNTSKTVLDVTFASAAPGAQVWFTAVWFNERMETGPAADKVTTNIAGGSAMAA
jgi:hypothetical protein